MQKIQLLLLVTLFTFTALFIHANVITFQSGFIIDRDLPPPPGKNEYRRADLSMLCDADNETFIFSEKDEVIVILPHQNLYLTLRP